MEAMLLLAIFLFLGPLVVSIIVALRFAQLKSSVDDLKRRVVQLETQNADRGGQPAPAKPAIPPPLPAFFKPPPIPEPADRGMGFQPMSHRQDADAAVSPPSVNWESILGVKFFAWIGGFAFFLGVVFFVKYAFERNLITPAMRVTIGGIVGVALVFASLLPALRRYRVPAQSLCATGVLCLYASVYAASAFYQLIPITAASLLMWLVTAATLLLATRIDGPGVAGLAVVGGFVTPFLLRVGNANPVLFFGYVVVLDCAVAAVGAMKRWHYLLTPAALGSLVLVFAWETNVFSKNGTETSDIFFLVIEGLFLGICTAVAWRRSLDNWTIAAMAFAGLVPLVAFIRGGSPRDPSLAILLSDAGMIAFAAIHRRFTNKTAAMAALVGLAFTFTWLGEWNWCHRIFSSFELTLDKDTAAWEAARQMWLVIFRHVAIFLLFAATPYVVGTKRLWPWLIAAIAGPLQLWFVYTYVTAPDALVPLDFLWLLPMAFALPASFGLVYLIKREGLSLSSGDSRLASQGAAVLAFVSLIFPVQFEREWITLGWALESVALILLFRWIPNRGLRAVALIMAGAAFVRLAFNPALLHYHARTRVPIFNWYLYVYGAAALCFFLGARWFGQPREKQYESHASSLLCSLGGIVLFLLLNIEIADYFSIGPTLTFSFVGNFARDMTYSIAWAVFALGLLVIGIATKARGARFAAIALLCLTLAKLFLHDLDSLSQLYRIAAFITVAIIAITASFVYQRFLSPAAK